MTFGERFAETAAVTPLQQQILEAVAQWADCYPCVEVVDV
jgi:hypothetical protein